MALSFRLFSSISRRRFTNPGVLASSRLSLWNRNSFSTSTDQTGKDQRLYSEVSIAIKSSEEAVLSSYSQFIRKAAQCLEIDTNQVALPTKVERYTLLKSPHIYKKHRVQYEIRTHQLVLQFKQLTGETSDVFLEYIQRNCPEGVSMDIQQVALEELFLSMPPEAKKYLETQKKNALPS